MQLVYKVIVSCLPDVHLIKLLRLVQNCFPNKYNLDINDLRLFNYAIVSQQDGQFVGVLFVKNIFDNVHEVQNFCVLPRFRNNGLGSELIRCCQSELPKECTIGIYIDSVYGNENLIPEMKSKLADRLICLFERHEFHVSEHEDVTLQEQKSTNVYLKWNQTALSDWEL
jgi:hypothetical protein|tara:strand:- start:1236 stop:1742 length:507 start_codon:yes stop_codon:yes gene_type:complete